MGDVSAATSDIVAEESGEEGPEKEGGKLSLRMRLVTPMEEGSSERFSLQSKGPRWGRVRGPDGARDVLLFGLPLQHKGRRRTITAGPHNELTIIRNRYVERCN